MDQRDFEEKLGELIGEIERLPMERREHLHKLVEETRERHQKIRATVRGLQDSLDYLRLSVKYLVFDLEATRRENEYLRKMIARDEEEDRASD